MSGFTLESYMAILGFLRDIKLGYSWVSVVSISY